MLLNQIDLNLLVVLDAIYTHGSITRAAEKLHLTQPAVSHSLARLRGLLDDELFTREGRSITPTPLLRTLIEPMRRSLHGLENTLNEARRFDAATSTRHFRIGLRDGVEAVVILPVMKRMAEVAPHISVSAVRFDRRNLEDELSAGRLDLAFDIAIPHGERVRRDKLGPSSLVVVARRGHPRVKRGKIAVEDYVAVDHVVASSRPEGSGPEDRELAKRGLKRRIRLRCQQPFTAFCLIAQSDLFLTLPEAPAKQLNRLFRLTLAPLPFRLPTFDVYLYWHDSADTDPGLAWFRKQVAEVVPLPHE